VDPNAFVNRELSWLEFNRRVLEEAQDATVPLLERVKFLAIFSANLDEFFMVRVATLKRRLHAGEPTSGPDGLTPTETLMASLLACTNVITHKVAQRNGVRIHAMNVRLEAQFDRRGVQRMEEVHLPFPSVTLYIDLATDAEAAAVEKLKRELGMFCPVSMVLPDAGLGRRNADGAEGLAVVRVLLMHVSALSSRPARLLQRARGDLVFHGEEGARAAAAARAVRGRAEAAPASRKASGANA